MTTTDQLLTRLFRDLNGEDYTKAVQTMIVCAVGSQDFAQHLRPHERAGAVDALFELSNAARALYPLTADGDTEGGPDAPPDRPDVRTAAERHLAAAVARA